MICLIGGIVALVRNPSKPDQSSANSDEPSKQNAIAEPPRNQWKEPIRAVSTRQGGNGDNVVHLKQLKAASVYVKGISGADMATGSGFVFRAFEDTAYVVTNHHVVTNEEVSQLFKDQSTVPVQFPRPGGPPQMRRPGFPQPPIGPGIRPGQGVPPGARRDRSGTGGPFANLTVVFRSGTPEEQEVKATIVADDADVDLAILKVTGVRDVPNPIDCDRVPKLVETDAVLALGFPFGAALDPNKPNPAITISKGAITSLRQNSQGELEVVQIDADINPGNSGGPIVDEKTGALVGIAVAKVKNTRVGFAIPVHKLNRLVEARTSQR